MKNHGQAYLTAYREAFERFDWDRVEELYHDLRHLRNSGRCVFIFGNGGSAANALHWANDLLYPLTKSGGQALRAYALTADCATTTCLANDLGYEEIFAFQLRSLAVPGDVVIALSGSGNSPNIVQALHYAREAGLKSYAVVGYDGGQAKNLATVALHFPVQDMQMAEDFQLLLCHLLLKRLQAEVG